MPFAIAMTLVLFVSTALLLYQFWTGSLLPGSADRPEETAAPASSEPWSPTSANAA